MNSAALLTHMYNSIMGVTVWTLLVPWQLIRVVLKRGTMEELKMHLGFVTLEKSTGVKRCVVHGVSVGEVKAAEILIDALEKFATNLDVIITTGNRDGFRTATEDGAGFRSVKNVLLLPWDTKRAMRRWLRAIQPDMVVIIETEIWPNLFLSCRDLRIPLYIVSGRIYPRDLPRYRMARSFLSRILSCAHWIGVQSNDEQSRFISIGAPQHLVHVVGNIKLEPFYGMFRGNDERVEYLDSLADLIVAGSTHHPEEEWLLKAFTNLRTRFHDLRIVLAPRHVDRSESLMALVRSIGLNGIQWSAFDPPGDGWEVLVVDELGWLPLIYGHAVVAVIGGSFINHGGHNPAEAAVHGKPIVVGPSMHHFSPMVELFLRGRGIVKLESHEQLESTLLELLVNTEFRARLGQGARKVIDDSKAGIEEYCNAILRGIGLEPGRKRWNKNRDRSFSADLKGQTMMK